MRDGRARTDGGAVALTALPFGLAIGLAVGMLGGGGSVLAVPVLVYVLGQGVHEATTTSLVVVTAGALAGGLGHARRSGVCWGHAGAFTVAALPGVLAGTTLGAAVSGGAILAAFAVVMLLAGAATWRRTRGASPLPLAGHGCPPLRLARDLGVGLLVGVTTGFFGVGGGFLVVPALAVLLALSLRLAVGTSLVVVAATSTMGLGAHLLAGRTIDLGVTATMTAGCVVGALAGAAVGHRLSSRRLGVAFSGLVGAVAAYLLVSVAFLGGPPGS